jgi:hypothetical protein
MKKILSLIFITLFPILLYAQSKSGPGWKNVPSKQNFQDDANFAKKIYIGAVELTVSATKLNFTSNVTSDIQTQINGKQATLVSGSNIKTINSTSILGSGNLVISGGGISYPSGSGITIVSGGTSWGTPITNNSTNWNTAYSWGNHANAGYSSLNNPSFTTRITTPAITLGSTPITATGVDINNITGLTATASEINNTIDGALSTATELNILHNIDPSLTYIGDIAILTAQVDANLTDNTPTDAEITAAIGMTAAVAGKNYTRIIKDTNGSGLIYLCVSDGTNWMYIKFTIAV